jgi:hypothetical protein
MNTLIKIKNLIIYNFNVIKEEIFIKGHYTWRCRVNLKYKN